MYRAWLLHLNFLRTDLKVYGVLYFPWKLPAHEKKFKWPCCGHGIVVLPLHNQQFYFDVIWEKAVFFFYCPSNILIKLLHKKKKTKHNQAWQLELSPQRPTEEAATLSCGHMTGTRGNTKMEALAADSSAEWGHRPRPRPLLLCSVGKQYFWLASKVNVENKYCVNSLV